MSHKIRTNFATGFTLIELVIYVALAGILLVIMTEMFVSVLNVRVESEINSALAYDSKYILSKLDYDIKRSTNIITPAAAGSSSSILEIVINGQTYRYNLVNNRLQLYDGTQSYFLNSNQTTISNLTFQRIANSNGGDTIKIVFTIQSTVPLTSGLKEQTFVTTIGRR